MTGIDRLHDALQPTQTKMTQNSMQRRRGHGHTREKRVFIQLR